MTDKAYTGVPLHEGTTVLNAEGVRDNIVLEVTKEVERLAIRIRCCVYGTHTDLPDGAVLELDDIPVLPVIDWCTTEQEIDQSAIGPESRLRLVVTDPSMESREIRLTVITVDKNT